MSRAGELTAGMVHEVRNALGTVAGYARLIERGAERDDVSQAARSILDECAAVEEVVRRFMEFVKRETLDVAAFAIDRLLARVAAREGRSHPAIAVTLQGDADVMARGDESLLERAFENLVRNACQAARRQVRLDWSVTAERTVVTVGDDGPGLPPSRRAELRPFFSTRPGGLGLGLALAYKVIHLHGGALEMADGSEGGLAVTVTLPSALPVRYGA
jgi:signal transduction histidine kinase